MNKKNKKNQTGVALLLTLLILTSILVITLGAADLVFAGIKMNRLTGYSNIAFYASEAGMERVLWEARKNNLVMPDENQDDILQCSLTPELCLLANNSSYQVNFATSTPIITFSSVGQYQGVKRSVEGSYELR